MSQKAAATLSTLPVEMMRRIFDELDGTAIIISVRNICQSLRAATLNYFRYKLDLAALHKPDLHRLLPLIRPECVTALFLSDNETGRPSQIRAFLSRFDIGLFTRLRSLTLLDISQPILCKFLRQAGRCSLTSLTLRNRSKLYRPLEEQEIVEHFSTIITQPTLVRLELLTRSLSVLMNQQVWPTQSKLRLPTVACDSQSPLSKILD